MASIKNFLSFLNENWTMILVCIGIIISITKKTISFFSKTDEERIAIAKEQIKHTVLKLITDAEEDYAEWNKSGAIKRSQVIEQIFEMYPILSKAINQEELIRFIDEQIDESLVTLREIIENKTLN